MTEYFNDLWQKLMQAEGGLWRAVGIMTSAGTLRGCALLLRKLHLPDAAMAFAQAASEAGFSNPAAASDAGPLSSPCHPASFALRCVALHQTNPGDWLLHEPCYACSSHMQYLQVKPCMQLSLPKFLRALHGSCPYLSLSPATKDFGSTTRVLAQSTTEFHSAGRRRDQSSTQPSNLKTSNCFMHGVTLACELMHQFQNEQRDARDHHTP